MFLCFVGGETNHAVVHKGHRDHLDPLCRRIKRRQACCRCKTYELLLKLVRNKGQLGIAKCQQSPFEQRVVRRYYRWRSLGLRIENRKLYLTEKLVTKFGDMKEIVKKAFQESMGLGCRRLKVQLNEAVTGCSETNVLSALSGSKIYQRLNCKFSNKASLQTVSAKCVMSRNQIDLIHMDHVNYDGRTYRYALSIVDVFSRFIFLRPLQSKSGK